tara:strand:- start:4726 stop:5202 length:477 start_codon:yes stop_codon:yes gene_type:complete
MATQTIIQYLEDERYSALPGGASVPVGEESMNRRQTETFVANGTIAVGDVVGFDTSKTGADRVLFVIKTAAIANGNGLAVGVATEAATAGDNVKCVISGYANVSTAGTVAAINMLTASPGTAGTVDGRVAADIAPAFGVTLEARTGAGLVAAWIYKHY